MPRKYLTPLRDAYGVKNENREYLVITKHQGKMLNVPSLSTFKGWNEHCQKYGMNPDMICSHCFVNGVLKQYSNVGVALKNNHSILTTRLLSDYEISRLRIKSEIFRFEAFGDLVNDIQLTNYVNIAKAYPNTIFALWTKHFGVLMDWFRNGGRMPKNMNLMLSSPYTNRGISEMLLERIKTKYHKRVAIFTVYSKEYVEANGVEITCGARSCYKCRKCYRKRGPVSVNEQIK